MKWAQALVRVLVLSLGVSLLAAAPSEAHVQLRPTKAPADETTKFRLVAENERSDAQTRGLDMLLPVGVSVKGPERSAGWRVSARGRRLILSAPANKGIEPAAKLAFPISLTLPNRPGDVLVFKVLQKYDDGVIVRWIGPPDTGEPAPRVTLTKPKPKSEPSSTPSGSTQEPAGTPATEDAEKGEDGDDWLPVAGALVGVALLGLGAFALTRRRRKRRA
jgi:LPXTG-motif cell wall-anchored protein